MVRPGKPLRIRLNKDLTRNIKRGHAWLYSHSIDTIEAAAGSVAILLDRKGETRLASGIYDPHHPLPLRICRTQPPFTLDDAWMGNQLRLAADLRQNFFDEQTTGFRLVAGEGDALPGLIVDVYDSTAVVKLDGGAPEAFYQPPAIAEWLVDHLPLTHVILRSRGRGRGGQALIGPAPESPIEFLENGLRFTADVLQGQKTGFFLDQRDHRSLIRKLSQNLSVLNLFSFNGGFSIAAGAGGARQVVSVDIAGAAIEAAEHHWALNNLPAAAHRGVVADCFDYLEAAIRDRTRWDLVICDPPSFAPNEKARPQALAAYGRLARLSSKVTRSGGLLAVASCSSHVDRTAFLETNLEALGRTRRKATLLADGGLPVDHPTPLAMPELRYLKFLLFRLD